MNLEQLKNQKLLFLGRSTLFSDTEISNFLAQHDIEFSRSYEDNDYIVEHRMINPVEEELSNQAYEAGATFYKMEEFEETMSASLDTNSILMAIKLSHDSKRIQRMLANEYISDELFIKLLNLYQWEEESFGDSAGDRDILTFTLKRFLRLKPNEVDLYYSPLSLHKLAKESQNEALLLALINFPEVSFLQKDKSKITLREALAQSPYITSKIAKKLLSFRDENTAFFIAINEAVELDILKALYERSQTINQALASNGSIDDELFNKLLDEHEILSKYQFISSERYDLLKNLPNALIILSTNSKLDSNVVEMLLNTQEEAILQNLLLNSNLTPHQIEALYAQNSPNLHPAIAQNPKTSHKILEVLYRLQSSEVNIALALNPSTPIFILEELFKQEQFEINRSLAANPSTPLEILNILKIDTRLRNELTHNKTFTDSIVKSQGLYW